MGDYVLKIRKAWEPGADLLKLKVPTDVTYASFMQTVGDAVKRDVQKVRYFDEDGDTIMIESDKHLALAMEEFSEKRRFKIEIYEEDTLSKDQMITNVLHEYRAYLADRSKYHFGYPYNLHYDHEEIFDVMHYSINNLGDPFVESNYGVHSRKFELDVLAFFADMWKIPEKEYWGYVTSCGTEGNLHSILCAREMHPEGVLYSSKDAHYSVFKACRFYRMQYEVVSSVENGEMDYAHFAELLKKHPGKPAIVVANIGTTVKGAVDSVDKIVEIMEASGLKEENWFIHCDGALYALMLPFMREFEQVNFTKKIHSMCVSGHKFLGCPMPCGVVICRKQNLERVSEKVEYLNSIDTTIMGSRNGHAPIFLWYSLQKGGVEELKKKVKMCHANARLLFGMLKERGIKVMLNERSTTVVLERPPENFVKHWQLACEKDIAHVVVMPNVTVEKIVQFVDELVEARSGTWRPYKAVQEEEAANKRKPVFDFSGAASFPVHAHDSESPSLFHDLSFKKKRSSAV